MRCLLAVVVLALAPSLWADFSTEISGTIRSSKPNEKFAGVTVSIAFDPMRGTVDYRSLETLERRQGPLAKLIVTGSAVTDAEGNFTMTAEFKKDGEGNFVTTKLGKSGPVSKVYVFINIEKEGYLKNIFGAPIVEGEPVSFPHIYPKPTPEIKGKLLRLENREPASGVKLRLARQATPGMMQELRAVTVTTDESGSFRFHDPYGPEGNAELSILDSSLAFSLTSSARNPFSTYESPVDFGNLMVVPGGGLKLRCISDGDEEPISVEARLQHKESGRILLTTLAIRGDLELEGLPEGDYVLKLTCGSYIAPPDRELHISAGDVLDLGDIRFTTLLVQNFDVTAEDGNKIGRGQITAEFIESTPNGELASRQNGKQVGNSINNGFAAIARVFRGRWYIVFTSPGLAPAWTEVDLPASPNPKIILQKGGKIELSLSGSVRMDWLMVAISGSPAARLLAKHQTRYEPDLRTKPVGLLHDQSYPGERFSSDPLGTGTYLVLGYSPSTGLFSQNVEVVNGETTKVVITPQPSTLNIAVTLDGEPAADEKLYYHRMALFDTGREKPEIVELVCDKAGHAEFSSDSDISGYLLLQREHDWVMGAAEYRRKELYSALRMRSVTAIRGTTVEIAIESGDGEFYFLRIDAKLPKGASLASGLLFPKIRIVSRLHSNRGSADETNPTAQAQDGALTFGMLRPGNYTLRAIINTPEGTRVCLLREITVGKESDIGITLDVKFHKLTVQVKTPAGVDAQQVSVAIVPSDPTLAGIGFFASPKKDKENFIFEYIPSGDYCVTAGVPSGVDYLRGGKSVSVKRATKTKISIEPAQGSLELSFGNAHSGLLPGYMDECIRATIFDNKGNEIVPADTREVFKRACPSMMISALAPGTYTVRVRAHGMSEWVKEGVQIEDGIVTSLGVILTSSPVARITMTGTPAAVLAEVKLDYTDASGAKLNTDAPDNRNVLVEILEQGVSVIHITNLRNEMKKLTVRIPGYRAIVIDLSFSDGPALDIRLELEEE